jgi:antitoxin (DNA-binding transcriptional repressor) of toxin-antitoxin stability system
VLAASLAGEPQTVAKRGSATAVVVPTAEWSYSACAR